MRQWNWEVQCKVKVKSPFLNRNTRKHRGKKITLKISKVLIGVRHKVLCPAATVPAERGLQVLGLSKMLHKGRRTGHLLHVHAVCKKQEHSTSHLAGCGAQRCCGLSEEGVSPNLSRAVVPIDCRRSKGLVWVCLVP